MNSIGIVLVCYNRLDSLKRLIRSLECANYEGYKPSLIFSIDYSGYDDITNFANQYNWNFGPKIVITHESNLGLREHIIQCGQLTKEYDSIIVLEDDIFVSKSYFQFAVNAAVYYENDANIAGISLYSFQKNWLKWNLRFEPFLTEYDTFFLKIAQSWGQVWTNSKWKSFYSWYQDNQNFEDQLDLPKYLYTWPKSSWLKYYTKYCIVKNKFFVYPYHSFTTNFSDLGTHSRFQSNDHQVELLTYIKEFKFPRFDNSAIKYDEYMNLLNLAQYIDINEDEVCLDLWGTRTKPRQIRYYLTTKKMNYKILRTYQLSLRPIEMNIMYNLEGKGIFLYDTFAKAKNRIRIDDNLTIYSMRTSDWKVYLIAFLVSFRQFIKRKIRKQK